MASTRWTWVWVNSGSWWWTEKPGVLQPMGSQRVGHDWVNELNWTEPTDGSKFPCIQDFSPIINSLGLVKLISSPPRGTIPAGTTFNQPVVLVIMDNFSSIRSKFWLWSYDQRKIKMIFDKVVTIFFRFQRKLEGKICSPCSPRDSQESSPIPHFKGINSSTLSLLYGPALTSLHDYWKNHSFDYMNLCW